IEISPLDSRLSVWGALLAVALIQSKDLDSALHRAELACQRDHRNYIPRVVVAGIHLLKGDQASARRALDDAFRIMPDLESTQVIPLLGETLGGRLLKIR
ncbi:MAG: hypothetical protein OEW79_10350, partial [Betaproteobacteria bacterium]|nr:hypothetical protein [Betaproteobacteria bacterium]